MSRVPGDYKSTLQPASGTVQFDTDLGFNLTAGASSVQSDILETELLRIATQVAIWYAVGSNPNAVSSGASSYLPAGAVEQVAIQHGNKISVLQASSGGTVNITPAKVV